LKNNLIKQKDEEKRIFIHLSFFLIECTAKQTESYEADFVSPPDYARPHAYRRWLEGYTSPPLDAARIHKENCRKICCGSFFFSSSRILR
jgi:hypothetical protein